MVQECPHCGEKLERLVGECPRCRSDLSGSPAPDGMIGRVIAGNFEVLSVIGVGVENALADGPPRGSSPPHPKQNL